MTQIQTISAQQRPTACRIVHLGLGGFHRAHQAMYLQQCINAGQTDWGIASANLRSNHSLVTSLREHEHRYHIAENQDSQHMQLREITAIGQTLYAGAHAGQDGIPDDHQALLDRIADPATRIVTLTITEKGYCLIPSSGELDTDNELIRADMAQPQQPQSAPGMLVAALEQRRQAGGGGITILSCDNMPDNGQRCRNAVLGMARAQQAPELAEWIRQHVHFPCSMVDRIVPGMSTTEHQRLAELEITDPNTVVCEAFAQWVIEDDFAAGRPDWEPFGVEMVADVTPFETMKLRMLNGSHSLLAYLGSLAGIETVAEAVARDDIRQLLHTYMRAEAAPTLAMPAGTDLDAYRESLLQRFGNDSLAHQLQQIATDGSQKIAQRWLSGALIQLEQDGPIDCVALGVAGWIRYMAGRDLQGRTHDIHDPRADELAQRYRDHQGNTAALIRAFLEDDSIFEAGLAQSSRFIAAVQQAYQTLIDHGLAAAIAALPDT